MTVGRAKRAAREREAKKAAARDLAADDAVPGVPIDAAPAPASSKSPSRRPRRKVAGGRKRGCPS
eukprot:7307204-Prymnesium_polylepis.1